MTTICKIVLAIFLKMVYTVQEPAGVMELVDVVDSKSTAGDSVPVRVRSPAPNYGIPQRGIPYFYASGLEPQVRVRGARAALLASSPSAAGGRYSEGAECAAVYKIEEKRKPEDFVGYRNRTPAYYNTYR